MTVELIAMEKPDFDVYREALRSGSWRDDANCIGFDKLMFPHKDDITGIMAAKALCRMCTVSDECFTYAFETNQKEGVWGGTSDEERRGRRVRWLANKRRANNNG